MNEKASMFKKSFIPGLFAGLLYATVLAIIDNREGKEFNIGVFCINLILFGIFMSGYNYFAMKRRIKKQQDAQEQDES